MAARRAYYLPHWKFGNCLGRRGKKKVLDPFSGCRSNVSHSATNSLAVIMIREVRMFWLFGILDQEITGACPILSSVPFLFRVISVAHVNISVAPISSQCRQEKSLQSPNTSILSLLPNFSITFHFLLKLLACQVLRITHIRLSLYLSLSSRTT